MKLYKLTNRWKTTYGDTPWGEGVKHQVRGDDGLCSSSWIHAYESPLMAVAMDPVHIQVLSEGGILWEARGGRTILRNGDLKCGVKTLTTLKQVDPPKISSSIRIRWAILCARAAGVENQAWLGWSEAWLSGEDRSPVSASKIVVTNPIGLESTVTFGFQTLCWNRSDLERIAYYMALTAERATEKVPELPALALLEQAIAEEEALGEIRQ